MKTFEEYRFTIRHSDIKISSYKYYTNDNDELVKIIEKEIDLQGSDADLNCIDTSKIDDMSDLFSAPDHKYAKSFNGDISNWDVSNVTRMYGMFFDSKFNGEISKWVVSNVTDMKYMFSYSQFNQDISNWDVSNVTNMYGMFYGAKSFNQDISKWDVSAVTDSYDMFKNCSIKEEYKPTFE